jgi:hypothetical protein
MEYDIFISYSSKDHKVVSNYANFLREKGYAVWIDQVDISHGHEFPEEITKAIQGCSILLFFSSQHSNASKWVKREIVYADNQNKTILPIRLDNAEYNRSLQLLLSGVEHIDAVNKTFDEIKNILLASLEREIGNHESGKLCPVISKSCPIGKTDDNIVPSFQKTINEPNWRETLKYRIRCEAFVFTSLCEAIWLLIIGCPLVVLGLLTHTISLFVCTVVAYFLAIYTTHLSTNSFYVPGWYNRHLTSYGALILAMDFFVSAACFSISIAFSIDVLTSLPLFACSILGIICILCIYRLKRIGYYLLWIGTILLPASTYNLWASNIRIIGMVSLFVLLVIAMMMLTYTLKLRFNGSSTWGLLFGNENGHKDQRPSIVERFLLKVWVKLYK